MEKRNIIRTGFVFIITAVLFFTGCGKETDQARQVSVNGEAIVYVTPDKVLLNFGVYSENKVLKKAVTENNEIIGKVNAVVRGHKVEEKDIQTGRLNVGTTNTGYPDYKFTGYSVSNEMVVTVYDVEIVEQLVLDLFDAGVNNLRGITFQTTELQKYRSQARTMAVEAAHKKAVEMTGVLGQEPGKAISIVEGVYSSYSPSLQTQNMMVQEESAYRDVESDIISLGQIPISASVSVVFEIED